MKKHIIWQNYNLDLENWEDLLQDYPDVKDPTEQYTLIEEENAHYLEDERENLSKELPEEIICIATLGLWDGRKNAYKELKSKNLADCLQFDRDCDYAEWYVDEHKNLRSRQSHHDGSNNILYRMWQPGISDTQRDYFLHLVCAGKADSKIISRYTKSIGNYVGQIYGW